MFQISKICLLILILQNCDGAKILGFFSVPSYSHQIVFAPIWQELARRGHEMVVLTPNILKDNPYPNLRQIDLKFGYEILHAGLNLSDVRPQTWRKQYWDQMDVIGDVEEAELALEETQEILKNEKFDLVIIQWMSPTMIALGAKFRCPIVTVSSLNAYNVMHDQFGNPSHPVLHPEYMTGLEGDLPFWDRLESTLFALWQRWHYNSHVIPRADKVIKKYMGRNMPYLGDIQKNVSLMLLNVNPLMSRSRPNLPNVIEFTGMHIRKHQPLPEDLQEYLDNSKNGVIYMSLGTNVKSSALPLNVRRAIVQALSEVKYDVLWKFELDNLENKPKNVMIRKWIPQQDVLGHKNVKLFITQGGSQSMEETIHNQVPLVGIPVFSDQPRNIKKAMKLGIGLGVSAKTVTKEEFKRTILEVIENKKYKENIINLSILVKDQPMPTLDRVIWWIEYVIRHKGAYHMRSPYADIEFWKYIFLDQIIFIIFVTISICYIALKSVKIILKYFSERIKIKIKSQ